MIYVFGDSHGTMFTNVSLPDMYFAHMPSVTMHKIGRDNNIPQCPEECMNQSDIAIVCYGEIDCRCQIMKQVQKGRDEDEVIESLVMAYMTTLKRILRRCRAVIVVAVVPPTRQEDYERHNGAITHEFPFVGSDKERVKITQKVNSMLEKHIQVHESFLFFSPFSEYTRNDGTLKHELSDNQVHISLDENAIITESIEHIIRNCLENKSCLIDDNICYTIGENVCTQKIDTETSVSYLTSHELLTIQKSDYVHHLFLFESPYHGIFGHWVHEASIFILQFKKMVYKYPSLKLAVNANPYRSFKRLFLEALDVNENHIHWLENTNIKMHGNEISYQDLPSPNKCIICPVQCLTITNCKRTKEFSLLVDNLHNTLMLNKQRELNPNVAIFFKRSESKDNSRTSNPDYTKVYSLLEKYETTKIYDTKDTKNLHEQINLLGMGRDLYVDYGSAFVVNGMCCEGSNIYVTNDTDEFDTMLDQYTRFPCIRLLVDKIRSRNNVYNLTHPIAYF